MKPGAKEALNPQKLKNLDKIMRGGGNEKSGARSARSGRSGSAIENLDEKSLEELESMISLINIEINKRRTAVKKVESNKIWTNTQKKEKLKDTMIELEALYERMRELEVKREEKIPLEDKLPKDSTFYKHMINTMFTGQMSVKANEKLDEDRDLLNQISVALGPQSPNKVQNEA